MIAEIVYVTIISSLSFIAGRLTMKTKVIRLINRTIEESTTSQGVQFYEGVMSACNEIYKGIYSWLFTI